MKLIDKDKVIAELDRKATLYFSIDPKKFRDYVNTLEVKEVDLDKMLTEFMSRYAYENGGEYPSSIDIAHRFFELGLNAQKGE